MGPYHPQQPLTDRTFAEALCLPWTAIEALLVCRLPVVGKVAAVAMSLTTVVL